MSPEMLALLLKSFWETCYMVLASTILATLIGVPLGVILTVTRKNHILPNAPVNSVLGAIVNATRSTPFIILMVAIIPLTRHGWYIRWRRLRRSGDPLRLSAFPNGRYVDHCRRTYRYGPIYPVTRRLLFQKA